MHRLFKFQYKNCYSVITANDKSNAKNKKNPNANHGNKRFTIVSAISTITEISLTENRIINLENLKKHKQEIT